MKMIVKNLLSLNTLKKARIIAGDKGVYNNVDGVTILEIAGDQDSDAIELLTESAKSQDIMISALYTVKDDIVKQCDTIKSMHRSNVSGLIVFYYGRIIKAFSREVIQLCNQLCFPLIVIDYEENKGISYEDVMKEIFSTLKQQADYFHRRVISAMWKQWENGGTAADALKVISKFTLAHIAITSFTSKQILLSTEEACDEALIKRVIEKSVAGNNGAMLREKNEMYLVEHYHSNKLDVIIVLKTANNNKVEDWMLSCVKLCVDIYHEELALTGNDEIIKLLVEGTLDLTIPILCENEESKWNALILEGPDEGVAKAILRVLDSRNIPYLSGKFKSYKIILFLSGANTYDVQDEIKELFEGRAADICIYLDRIRGKRVMMNYLSSGVEMFPYCEIVFPVRHIIEKAELKLLKDNKTVVRECELDEDILGPLKEFDQAHNGNLMETLQAFMIDFNGDYSKTSQHLFVHKNTIQYRINSAMEILNLNMKDNAQMFYLYNALIAERLKEK